MALDIQHELVKVVIKEWCQLHRPSQYWGMTANGPLARYVKLWAAHALGMPGAFFPPPRCNDSDMHHGTCASYAPWCMPGSQTSGFLWSRWRDKTFRHSRRMHNPQFYVSGKRPMETHPFIAKYIQCKEGWSGSERLWCEWWWSTKLQASIL